VFIRVRAAVRGVPKGLLFGAFKPGH
jgi:hypothetical protein